MRGSAKQLLTKQYHGFLVFATLVGLPGCAYSPLMKEWDWSTRPNFAEVDARQKQQFTDMRRQMKKIYKENPSWRNATTDSEIILEIYDENGRNIGSARGKR